MMSKTVRVLSWALRTDGGVVWFTNEDEDTEPGGETQVQLPEHDHEAMGYPTEITVTIQPGDRLNGPEPSGTTVAEVTEEIVPEAQLNEAGRL